MSKPCEASLAWNLFCDDGGAVIGRFVLVGNTVRVDCPSGRIKSVSVEPGEKFLSLVEKVLTEDPL
jgi:hypothetical protein